MFNAYLTCVTRKNLFDYKSDAGEKTGNVGLGLLRVACGKTLIIEKIPGNSNAKIIIKKHSLIQRVAAIGLFILAFPITLSLAGIGCTGVFFSKSQHEILELAKNSVLNETKSQIRDAPIKPLNHTQNEIPIIQEKSENKGIDLGSIKDKQETIITKENNDQNSNFLIFKSIFLKLLPITSVNHDSTKQILNMFDKISKDSTNPNQALQKFYDVLDQCQNLTESDPLFIDKNAVDQAKKAFMQFLESHSWISAKLDRSNLLQIPPVILLRQGEVTSSPIKNKKDKAGKVDHAENNEQKPLIDVLKFEAYFLSKVPLKYKNGKQNQSVIHLIKSITLAAKPTATLSLIQDDFFNALNSKQKNKNDSDFINGNTVAQAKEAFLEFTKNLSQLSFKSPDLANNQTKSMSQGYQFFKKPSSEIYKHLSQMRKDASYESIAGVGGSASIASEIYEDNQTKLGIMFAANSGLPGGKLLKEIKANALPANYMEMLNENLNVTTQEESLLAAVLIAGLSQYDTEDKKIEYLKTAMGQIANQWGLVQEVDNSLDTKTKQGIDFTISQDSNDYANTHVVKGPYWISPLQKPGQKYIVSPDFKSPLHLLVFADSINANPKIGSSKGSMKRTLNQKAVNDYAFFKECIKKKLSTSLDAMAEAGVTHALLAGLSVGIYAGQHKQEIGKDFFKLLTEVLNEPVGPQGELRGTYFKRVVYPKLSS